MILIARLSPILNDISVRGTRGRVRSPSFKKIGQRMRIDTEVKLDYRDVLIRPKRSTLGSRKEVDL